MIFLFAPVMAQVNLDIQLPPRALQKIQKAKSAHEKATQYKKYYSKEQKKAEKKLAKAKAMATDSAWMTDQLPDVLDTAQLYTLKDSALWAEKVLNTYAIDDEYKELAFWIQQDSIQTAGPKNKFNENAGGMLEDQISGKLPGDFEGLGEMPDLRDLTGKNQLAEFESLGSNGLGKWEEYQKLDPVSGKEKVAEHLRAVPAEQMAAAQTQLAVMKKKYVTLPGLDRENEAVKRSSLKGHPTGERIYLGGNVALHAKDPILVDIDLQLGILANKNFVVGFGIIYREEFGKSKTTGSYTGDARGVSFFTTHELKYGLFAHAEGRFVARMQTIENGTRAAYWQRAYYLGIGKAFQIRGKFDMTCTMLYDFNHLNNSLHPHPWVFRVGYRIR